MGTVYGMVLGPPLAVFLLEKPYHARRAHHPARHGLSCVECTCDKAAHCEDRCMEEETFSTMMLGASLCHNVSSHADTRSTVAPPCFRGPALFPDTESRLHFFQGLQIFLEPIDMLLHLHNGQPEFGHRSDRAAYAFHGLPNAFAHPRYLRVGIPLTERPTPYPCEEHSNK
jgi:hypothetical protein